MIYKKHNIKITEGENNIKVEVIIKGKEYGLIFKKNKKVEAIEMAKQTIDYLSPQESQVINYKNSTIYIIRLNEKYIAKGLYEAYGVGKLLIEESGQTKKEVIKKIKVKFKEVEIISNNIKEKENGSTDTATN